MAHVIGTQENSQLLTLRSMRGVEFETEGRRSPLVIPSGVYDPDTWTRMLIRGLVQYLAEHHATGLMVEVGVGSGVVPVILGRSELPARSLRYVGLDINNVACETARLNLQLNGSTLPSAFISGGYLLEKLPAELHGSVDLLAANLPQVPDLDRGRSNPNDYYQPRRRWADMPLRFEQCGTGLLFDFLTASRAVLSSSGAVVTTVAGRCGKAELSRLFNYCEMTYEVLHEAVVRQDPGTTIEHFRRTEETAGIAFEFYADEAGRNPIGADAAALATSQGLPVYHDLYAVAARPTSYHHPMWTASGTVSPGAHGVPANGS